MKQAILCGSVVAIVLMAAAGAQAAPIGPASCPSFGSQPAETFNPAGPSGIPNDAVCHASLGGEFINLSATPRHLNAPLTNNGAGTFTAQAGGDILDARPDLFRFNGDYDLTNNSLVSLYAEVFLDTSNGVNTDQSSMARIQVLLAPGQSLKDSQNLAFTFLQTGFPPSVTGSNIAPDVNANGEFNLFADFRSVNGSVPGDVLLSEGIVIDTTGGTTAAPVPEPATLALLGSGLIGAAYRTRKRKKA